jgi:hypothetical protein
LAQPREVGEFGTIRAGVGHGVRIGTCGFGRIDFSGRLAGPSTAPHGARRRYWSSKMASEVNLFRHTYTTLRPR